MVEELINIVNCASNLKIDFDLLNAIIYRFTLYSAEIIY